MVSKEYGYLTNSTLCPNIDEETSEWLPSPHFVSAFEDAIGQDS